MEKRGVSHRTRASCEAKAFTFDTERDLETDNSSLWGAQRVRGRWDQLSGFQSKLLPWTSGPVLGFQVFRFYWL